jgi:hypothetical protein
MQPFTVNILSPLAIQLKKIYQKYMGWQLWDGLTGICLGGMDDHDLQKKISHPVIS